MFIKLLLQKIIYKQAYRNSFHQKMKFFRFSATLTITDAVRHSSEEQFYQALTGLLVCSMNSNATQAQHQIGHTKQKKYDKVSLFRTKRKFF